MLDSNIPGGYILLSRKLLQNGIMEKPPLYFKVWVWLLLNAQHKDFGVLKRGQIRTSIPEIQKAMTYKVGYREEKPSRKQIWGILNWLRNPDGLQPLRNPHEGTMKGTTAEPMIETVKVTHGLVITICNYSIYQDPKNYEGNNDSNNEGTTREQRREQMGNNNNKNDKNEKNDKNTPTPYPSPKGGTPGDTSGEPTCLEDILNRHPRYTSRQYDLIRKYWDMIRFTRKSGKVAVSVIAKEMDYWERFSPDIVEQALTIHTQRHQTKPEEYTRGIMRRLHKERELRGVKHLGTNRRDSATSDISHLIIRAEDEGVSDLQA